MVTKLLKIGSKKPMKKFPPFWINFYLKRSEEPRKNFSGILLKVGDLTQGSTMELVIKCPSCTFAGLSTDLAFAILKNWNS